jgi:replicative DNA helicase
MNNVDLLFQKIDKGRQGKNIGLKTGIPKMDEYTGGIQPVYTLIFGTSGSGKSALALYSYIYRPLRDYPDKNIKLCYFSLELSAELLLAKLLCLYIFEEFGKIIPYTKLMS